MHIFKLLFKQIYLELLYFIINNFILHGKLRGVFYRVLHPDMFIKRNVSFRKSIVFYNGSRLNGKLIVGEKSFINDNCFIDYSSKVVIGKNVAIGMRALILSGTHKIGSPIRCGQLKNKTTTIGDNSWIGAGVIIYPGINIGKGCVIAAGEIVYSSVADNKLLKNSKVLDILDDKIK